MIQSMTGYGVAQFENKDYAFKVEIKALNSKFLDVHLKLPRVFLDKELELRSLISERLERGKVSVMVDFISLGANHKQLTLDEDLFVDYYSQLKTLSDKIGADDKDLFKIALESPEVMKSQREVKDYKEEWEIIKNLTISAANACEEFRVTEGKELSDALFSYAHDIERLLTEIKTFEPERIELIKVKLEQNLHELRLKEDFDKNRFEQEIIYYLEKYDIAEEKVRLQQHIDFFKEILLDDYKSKGKKLGFIGQEFGREINTIGSKANHAGIQKLVVSMKEELEKIKEQSLNIL